MEGAEVSRGLCIFPCPQKFGIAHKIMSKNEKNAPDKGAAIDPSVALETASADNATPDLANAARKSAGKAVWTGAAVGIGSAAIVAALLYTRKRS